MEQSTGVMASLQGAIHNTFGEEVFGIPMTPVVIGAFLCGVALFYLVMQRQIRRSSDELN